MSINVYLVFFHNVNPASFRKYAWIYCIVCFGGPCVPAIVLIAIRDDPKGPIFGDASVCIIYAGLSFLTGWNVIALVLDQAKLEPT